MMEAADDADGNGPELEDEEFMNQPFTADNEARILALCQHSDKLGVAIYLEGENVIKVSSDLPSSHADMAYTLEGLKAGLNPSLILTTTNISNNSELLQLLVAPLTEGGEPYAHQVLKNACWDYASAVRSTCANLRVLELLQRGNTPGGGGGGGGGGRRLDGDMGADWSNDEERAFNLLSGVIDFNAEQSVRALGALISHLQSSVFSLEVDGSVPVLAVREMDLLAALRVDALSLRSLGIFCEEAHPNVLHGRGRSKEGFSVFALYDRTRSVPGRRCLREWFARPSTDLRVIHARQDGVELLMRPEHAELVRVIGAGLARGFDLPRLLLRVKRVTAVYRDWCRIVQSAEAAAVVHDALAVLRRRTTHAPYAAFLDAVLSGISAPVMRRVARTLAGVIDVAASMDEKDLVLKHGLSPRLDTLRTTLGDLYNILHTVGGRIMHENPLLDDLTVEYVPQVGYLIALAGRNREFAPPTFQFAFAQRDTVFFKNELMLKLDVELGDIYADIADCKAQVVRQLEDYLLSEEVDLQATAASLAELDAVLSLASAAVDLGLVRPAVVEENVVVVKGGRHPLQELVVDAFIPNDTLLAAGGGHGTVALVTGANWSGKSVYIKQVHARARAGELSYRICGFLFMLFEGSSAAVAFMQSTQEVLKKAGRRAGLPGARGLVPAVREGHHRPHRPHLHAHPDGGELLAAAERLHHRHVAGRQDGAPRDAALAAADRRVWQGHQRDGWRRAAHGARAAARRRRRARALQGAADAPLPRGLPPGPRGAARRPGGAHRPAGGLRVPHGGARARERWKRTGRRQRRQRCGERPRAPLPAGAGGDGHLARLCLRAHGRPARARRSARHHRDAQRGRRARDGRRVRECRRQRRRRQQPVRDQRGLGRGKGGLAAAR
eukprot:TRINITY_DN262_c0_g1_i4.p1 TRINITY_DN262_c0_g1~~TRINITY_DN262_c0_g1_i4.p1  ORF type:complete len:897 (+),score=290.04 TRINITY_DN262_c0_g1_i4:187-2877(+)